MINYLIALGLTLIIESLIGLLVGFRNKKEFAALILVNLVTHPLLHLLFFLNNYLAFLTVNDGIIVLLEILITITEGCLLSLALKKPLKRMLLVSLAMNASSFLLGRILLS